MPRPALLVKTQGAAIIPGLVSLSLNADKRGRVLRSFPEWQNLVFRKLYEQSYFLLIVKNACQKKGWNFSLGL